MVVSWVMSILAVVSLSFIADLLLSGKRMGRFVSAVFASLTILIIVAPLPNIIANGFNAENILFVPGIETDDGYIQYANGIRASVLERGVSEQLAKDGYKFVEVDIDGEFNDEIKITSVSIYLDKMVMDEKVVHINKYEAITKRVCDYLKVDKGVVMIHD